MERRFSPAASHRVEVRADGDSARAIQGYAAVYYDGTEGTEYRLFSDLVERIMPGAFDRAIAEADDVRALFNHDSSLVLGRTPATLSLKSDETGLKYDIKPGKTTVADDVIEHISRGDVTGSSFAFTVERQEFEAMEDGTEVRKILSVRLFDVGPVTYPAYDATSATATRSSGEFTDAMEARDRWRRANDADRRLRAIEISLDAERMGV